MNSAQKERMIQETGSRLLRSIRKSKTNPLKKNWRYEKALSMALKSRSLKTSLLRFVDVLPGLKTPEQVLSHMKEYFKEGDLSLLASGIGKLPPFLITAAVKKQIYEIAKIFIAGASGKDALKAAAEIRKSGMAFSLDLLGEATLSEKEGADYQRRYLDLMDLLSEAKLGGDEDQDELGPVPSVNISVKATALYSQIRAEAWEHSKRELKKRLRPLFQKAAEKFIFLNLDMEQYRYKRLLMEIFQELLLEDDFKSYPHFGIVAQAYLKESFSDIEKLIAFARKRGCPISVRLVKGAYWDSEVLSARRKNWPIPVYTEKALTDANFEKCTELLLQNGNAVKTAIASHNIRSIAHALALRPLYPKACLEFQALYGMGQAIANALKKESFRPRLYTPLGELLPGMSYLVRRLLENSSNQSFILSAFSANQPSKELLAPPCPKGAGLAQSLPPAKIQPFQNHPPLDFTVKKNRERFQKALEGWRRKLPMEIPLMIDGKELRSGELLTRENPAQTDQIISRARLASSEQAERAIQKTADFFESYKFTPPEERIACLERLASLIQEREFELAALEVLEAGKSWAEAHADVAEAIDFCRYYARRFRELSLRRKTCDISGEESFSAYEPVGAAAVIAPWNFPLAILTGMTAAPLVCGNTVLIKPAEQSGLIAWQLAQLLLKSGFPKGSFAFLPGRGEETGAFLARHPKVSIVSFTGSFETGAQIIKETAAPAAGFFASGLSKGQKQIKKLVLEMGGKNAIIVDSSADLDEAIAGILSSAFGYQGQKCSACSRALVVEDIYDRFIERFLPAVESLISGLPERPESFIGPLIDKEAAEKVRSFLKSQKETYQILYEGKAPEGGWFLPPMALLAKDANSPLMQQELFAPVLGILKVKDLDEAIRQANNSRYGLTAGLYSRHPGHVEIFKNRIEAGNVYINRNCVGALVQRHPFGGRKMSGLGSKAGGPEYLKQFLQEKILTENTMRRGFAPEIFSESFLIDLSKEG